MNKEEELPNYKAWAGPRIQIFEQRHKPSRGIMEYLKRNNVEQTTVFDFIDKTHTEAYSCKYVR